MAFIFLGRPFASSDGTGITPLLSARTFAMHCVSGSQRGQVAVPWEGDLQTPWSLLREFLFMVTGRYDLMGSSGAVRIVSGACSEFREFDCSLVIPMSMYLVSLQ